MKNSKLRKIIEEIIEKRAIEGASVKITQYGNGYYVCVRAPHVVESYDGSTHYEYSLPVGFMVWGIQTEERVRRIANDFFDYRTYLARQ